MLDSLELNYTATLGLEEKEGDCTACTVFLFCPVVMEVVCHILAEATDDDITGYTKERAQAALDEMKENEVIRDHKLIKFVQRLIDDEDEQGVLEDMVKKARSGYAEEHGE